MDKLVMQNGHTALRIALLAMQLLAGGAVFAQDEFADLPDPTRPWEAEGASVLEEGPRTLTLESTVVSGERRLAIINGKTLGIGALIDGYRIKDIAPYRVDLDKQGQAMTLHLVGVHVVRQRGDEER